MRTAMRSIIRVFVMVALVAPGFVRGLVAGAIEPAHARNDLYRDLLGDGATLAGTRVAFPEPLLHDGDTREAERSALLKLAGSERAVAELVRNSIVAPQILKIR